MSVSRKFLQQFTFSAEKPYLISHLNKEQTNKESAEITAVRTNKPQSVYWIPLFPPCAKTTIKEESNPQSAIPNPQFSQLEREMSQVVWLQSIGLHWITRELREYSNAESMKEWNNGEMKVPSYNMQWYLVIMTFNIVI